MDNYKYLNSSNFFSALLLIALTAPAGCGSNRSDGPTSIVTVAPVTPAERTTLLNHLHAGVPIPPPALTPPSTPTHNSSSEAPQSPTAPTTPVAPPTPTAPSTDPSAPSTPSAPATPRPVATDASPLSSECQRFRAQLPPTLAQGFVTVPEDWAQPNGKQIQVFYYGRLLKDNQGQVIKPTLFYNGGPAADSHSSYQLLEGRSSAQTLSMIYLDQRGNGCSDAFPSSAVGSAVDAAMAKRLTLYGSRAIVRDSEAVRARLLGTQPWAVFGQSFGGEIVHRYIELAPEGLTGAYSHGATLVSDPITKIAGRLTSQQRVTKDYFAIYPDDAARLQSIRSAIPAGRCFEDGSSRVCGSVVMDGATIMLGFRTEWDSLHQWLGQLMGASHRLDEFTLSQFVRTFVFGMYASNGFASSVLSYWEVVPGYSDALGCQTAIARIKKTGAGDALSWPINECRLLMAVHYPWETRLPALGRGDLIELDSVAKQLAAHPALQVFLYSGGEDVFVPVALFSEETQRLGNRISYRNFPTSGHDGFYTEQQVWEDLNSPSI